MRLDHGGLEAAKWIALASMFLDHLGKIAATGVLAETHVLGRVAFPLLAWLVAARLVLSPRLSRSYLLCLLPWALISQPVYVLAGRDWTEGNILFTLAAGVGLVVARRSWLEGRRSVGVLIALPALAISPFVEFGVVGVLLVPALAVLASRSQALAAWCLGPLGVLANVSLGAPWLTVGALGALFASVVAVASPQLPLRLPRLPKQLFYAFYPAHLLALHALDGWL